MAFTIVLREEAVFTEDLGADGITRPHDRYFGKKSGRGERPEAFIAHVHNHILGAHFHAVDQYQVMIGSPGSRYQKHQLPAMMVHYADAYCTYGPISAEENPMHFLTLRAEPGNGFAGVMPGERDKLAYRGRRNRHADFDHLTDSELPEAGTTRVEPIWDRDEDGFEALAMIAGPGATLVIPSTEGTEGQYVFVADGWVDYEGKQCGFESLAWQDRDEESVELVAGSEGARVFVLRFPSPSSRIQHEQLQEVGAGS